MKEDLLTVSNLNASAQSNKIKTGSILSSSDQRLTLCCVKLDQHNKVTWVTSFDQENLKCSTCPAEHHVLELPNYRDRLVFMLGDQSSPTAEIASNPLSWRIAA